jgi:hypothetical protein
VTKTVPADERIQLLTDSMLHADEFTIRAREGGEDMRLHSSETQEGKGFPLRSDDELAIREEDGFGGVGSSDGLWIETEASKAGEVEVLRGIALERNVRREVEVAATVSSNTYPAGADFDTGASDTYPVELTNDGRIEEVLLSIVESEVDVELETADGDTVTVPVDDSASIDSYSCTSVTIRDPIGNGPRVAGGWAGE